MNDKAPILEFDSRNDFRKWLDENHATSDGIWVQFAKGSKLFTPHDALEEAICFGWIDGLIKSIDGNAYKKCFSRRKDKSKWSEKNKALFLKLKGQGLITEYGAFAFQNEVSEKQPVNKADIHSKNVVMLKGALGKETAVIALFDGLAASRQRQLAGFYCEAKTDETREKRKKKIIDAIKNRYKGMLY